MEDKELTSETVGVDTIHPAYTAMLTSWKKMFDTCISETHVHEQGTTYVPKLDKMDDSQYESYIKRAEFPMFTKHALDSFVGMSMRKDILISGIDYEHPFFLNCDGKGTTIQGYCEKIVRSFLQYKRCGTLIEMPSTDPNMSLADAEARNVSVRLAFYDHAAIINWKTSTENNLNILTMVVLLEAEDVSANEFEHEYEARYRVLRLQDGVYSQEIYNNDQQLVSTTIPLMNGKPMDFIPFTIHGGIQVQTPTMLPIAEQNLHWYLKDADYQHGLHYTALPTPYVIGVDPKDPNAPSTIGPQEMWFLPIGATCGMLEFKGAGLNEIANSMSQTLNNITVLASQILVPKSAYDESATAASIRSASETASLSSMVNDLSEEVTLLVKIASQWGGFFVEDTQIEINSDFIPLTLSGADVSSYVSSVLKQGFSQRTLFELLKKGEIIEGSRQYEDEMAAIDEEAKKRREEEVQHAEDMAEATAAGTAAGTPEPEPAPDFPVGSQSGSQDGTGPGSAYYPEEKRADGQSNADGADTNSSDKIADE